MAIAKAAYRSFSQREERKNRESMYNSKDTVEVERTGLLAPRGPRKRDTEDDNTNDPYEAVDFYINQIRGMRKAKDDE